MQMYIDIAIFLVSIATIWLNTKLAIRTEKEFDVAAKYFLTTSYVLFFSSIFIINRNMGIVPVDYAEWIFQFSRFLAMIFFALGCFHLLKMVNRESGK